jgi:ribonuclease HI
MVSEPVAGEAMGAMLTMEFCRERGFQDIILEGDSLQVIQGLKERTSSWR